MESINSPNGSEIVIDKMDRWDAEWRGYRGGQNTPLIIMNVKTQDEILLPNPNRTTDIKPVWLNKKIYHRNPNHHLDFLYNQLLQKNLQALFHHYFQIQNRINPLYTHQCVELYCQQ